VTTTTLTYPLAWHGPGTAPLAARRTGPPYQNLTAPLGLARDDRVKCDTRTGLWP